MSTRILVLAVGLVALPGAYADDENTLRDAVLIGGQHYLRTQHRARLYGPPNGSPDFCSYAGIGAQDGHAVYLLYNEVRPTLQPQLFLSGFDAWTNPIYTEVKVTADDEEYVYPAAPAHCGAYTWVSWGGGRERDLGASVRRHGGPTGCGGGRARGLQGT